MLKRIIPQTLQENLNRQYIYTVHHAGCSAASAIEDKNSVRECSLVAYRTEAREMAVCRVAG